MYIFTKQISVVGIHNLIMRPNNVSTCMYSCKSFVAATKETHRFAILQILMFALNEFAGVVCFHHHR